jgi:hypothetical protein
MPAQSLPKMPVSFLGIYGIKLYAHVALNSGSTWPFA